MPRQQLSLAHTFVAVITVIGYISVMKWRQKFFYKKKKKRCFFNRLPYEGLGFRIYTINIIVIICKVCAISFTSISIYTAVLLEGTPIDSWPSAPSIFRYLLRRRCATFGLPIDIKFRLLAVRWPNPRQSVDIN